MGVTVRIEPRDVSFANELANKVIITAENAMVTAGQQIRQEIKTLFVGPPAKQGIRDNQGELWVRTSRIAMINRKTYPKGSNSKSKKGYTSAQAQYLYAAPTLVDTGSLRDSMNVIRVENDGKSIEIEVGTTKDYARVLDEGGPSKVNGKPIMVPRRPFLWISEKDKERVEIQLRKGFQENG